MIVEGVHRCINCMSKMKNEKKCRKCGYVQGEYHPSSCWLIPGTVLIQRYVIGKVLGEGNDGMVYLAWDQVLEMPVAIKEYFPMDCVSQEKLRGNHPDISISNEKEFEKRMRHFLREAKFLCRFHSLESVISILNLFYANQTAYIVMEYIQGETLQEYVDRKGAIPAEETLALMRPFLLTLSEIHKTGLIHRDISPDNLLYDKKRKKLWLIDFGCAQIQNETLSGEMVVSFKPGYSPPEQYRENGKQGPRTDLYAVGAVMYFMLTGREPVDAVERMIGKKLKSLEEYGDLFISQNQKKGIMKAMAIKPENRFENVEQFMAELNEMTISEKDSWKKYLPAILVMVAVTIFVLLWYVRKRRK